MRRIGGLGVGDGIAIDVGGRRQAARLGRVFGGGNRRAGGGRRVVDRADRDRHRVRIAAAIAIADGVGKAVGAVVVGHRRVGIGAVGIDHHSSVRGIGRLGVGDGIAIDIGGDRQAARLGHVFRRRDGGARCRRRIIGGGVGKVDHDIGARGAGDGAGHHAAEGAIAETDAEVADVIRIGVRAGVAGEFQGGGGGAGARDFRRQAGWRIGKCDAGQRRAIAAAEAAVGQGDGRRHRKRTIIGGRFGEVGGAVGQARGRAVDDGGLACPGRADAEVEREIRGAVQRTGTGRIDARFDLERAHRIVVHLDAVLVLGDRAVIDATGRHILERDRTIGLGLRYQEGVVRQFIARETLELLVLAVGIAGADTVDVVGVDGHVLQRDGGAGAGAGISAGLVEVDGKGGAAARGRYHHVRLEVGAGGRWIGGRIVVADGGAIQRGGDHRIDRLAVDGDHAVEAHHITVIAAIANDGGEDGAVGAIEHQLLPVGVIHGFGHQFALPAGAVQHHGIGFDGAALRFQGPVAVEGV